MIKNKHDWPQSTDSVFNYFLYVHNYNSTVACAWMFQAMTVCSHSSNIKWNTMHEIVYFTLLSLQMKLKKKTVIAEKSQFK